MLTLFQACQSTLCTHFYAPTHTIIFQRDTHKISPDNILEDIIQILHSALTLNFLFSTLYRNLRNKCH